MEVAMAVVAMVGTSLGVLYVALYATAPVPSPRHPSELGFTDCRTKKQQQFTLLADTDQAPEVDLSVIVPAYNEEKRLPKMLEEAYQHLDAQDRLSFELIVVDDGSSDDTAKVAMEWARTRRDDSLRILKLHHNRGKGGAVRLGVGVARGEHILFADADGATRFSDIESLLTTLREITSKDGHGLAVGSRLKNEIQIQRSLLRRTLAWGFRVLVYFLCVRGVVDTQCGFKLFARSTARVLFHNLHIDRWAFDVELLLMAEHLSIPVAEVPIEWTEIGGSHISPMAAALEMLVDLIRIRLLYMMCIWSLPRSIR